MSGQTHWQKFARLVDYMELASKGVLRITPQFHFQVINHDPDDNIFTDCWITAGAKYVSIDDHHFAPIVTAGYDLQPISPVEFILKSL